MSHDL